jgi:hypothetical protein
MADTAAFFAKKKKGKKGFKSFNANKIDVSSVIPTTHVDAPEVEKTLDDLKVDDGWAESTTTPWGAGNIGSGEKVAELLDMQSLKTDDVAERLRIEETKAQLARAKEGMAKEAERLEKEKKEKEEKAASRAAGSVVEGGAGGKWIPSHLRGGNSIRGPAVMGGVKQPNMADEELFPDLAAADKILAEKEKQGKVEQERLAKGGIRAPSGWGARSESSSGGIGAPMTRQPLNLAPRSIEERKPLNLAPPTKKEESKGGVAEVQEKKVDDEQKSEPALAAAPSEEPKPEAVAPVNDAPKKDIKLKKKKKKDLSSFKPSG